MRFSIPIKADRYSQADVMPEQKLLADFWLRQVKSKQEALDWLKRCRNPMSGKTEVEIREILEAEDFGSEFTPQLQQHEQSLREQLAAPALNQRR